MVLRRVPFLMCYVGCLGVCSSVLPLLSFGWLVGYFPVSG